MSRASAGTGPSSVADLGLDDEGEASESDYEDAPCQDFIESELALNGRESDWRKALGEIPKKIKIVEARIKDLFVCPQFASVADSSIWPSLTKCQLNIAVACTKHACSVQYAVYSMQHACTLA